MSDTFPRQQARTQNFSLGAPRSFRVAADGSRVAFLRSKGGDDPVTCLWALDLPAGAQPAGAQPAGAQPAGAQPGGAGSERLVVDPATIGSRSDEPAAERARRERSREKAGGVVAFATDDELTVAAFALAGQVYTVRLTPGGAGPRAASAQSPAIDPRPDPAGRLIGYVCDGALRITDLLTGQDRELIGPGSGEQAALASRTGDVTYGLAEFIAAEEMGRMRGYWWAPDSRALLVARVDNSPVRRWHIADPANPDRPPVQVGYPAAGTPNALVSLHIVSLDGRSTPVRWDALAFPYLTVAHWERGAPLIVVQSRDQRATLLLSVDVTTGATTVLRQVARHSPSSARSRRVVGL